MDDLRDALNSFLNDDQQTENPAGAPQDSGAESGNEGTTQADEQQTKAQTYELGGRTFKSWDEVQKWTSSLQKDYTKKTQMLSEKEKFITERKQAHDWWDQLQQHPELQSGMTKLYEDYNKKLAQGQSPAKAAKESGLSSLPPEMQDNFKWLSQMKEEYEAEAVTEGVDEELKELRTVAPKITDATINQVYELCMQYAQDGVNLSLSKGYKMLMAEVNAKKADAAKDTQIPGKMGSMKTAAKKPDLSDPEQARKNLTDILNGNTEE